MFLIAQNSTELIRQLNSGILVNLDINKYEILNNGAFKILQNLEINPNLTEYLTKIKMEFGDQSACKTQQFIDYIISKGFFYISKIYNRKKFISLSDNILRIVRSEIAITNKCNLNCFYCYAKDDRNLEDLDIDNWKILINKLVSNGLRVVLFSGGEPFLYDSFFSLLEKYHKKLIIEINSNGTLIDSSCAKRLSQFNLKSIQISLDSPTKDYHDSMRGKGSWDKAINAISLLRENGIHVRINTVVTQKNEHHIDEMIKLSNKLDVELTIDSIKYHGQTQNSLDINSYKKNYKLTKISEEKYSNKLRENEFIPLCQCQIGYISISSNGTLKPCNLSNTFYKNSDLLTDTIDSSWFDKYFGDTKLGRTINMLNETHNFLDDIDQGDFPCKLQAAVECLRQSLKTNTKQL